MRSQSIANVNIKGQAAPTHKMGFAKKQILAWLQHFTVGHLNVLDGKQQYQFGDTSSAQKATIIVNNPECYRDILLNGTVGSGEAYIKGFWHSPNLTAVIQLMVANMQALHQLDGNSSIGQKLALKMYAFLTRNTADKAKENIAAHYDLGNDFFALFLDETKMYSAAIYPGKDAPLSQAAVHKLDVICQKLQLTSEHNVIEIGTGWGGFAIHAAQHYGCKVTTTTISQEQFNYAEAKIKALGLGDKITLLLKDYRELNGQFDRLVSIEMIEAVGYQFYDSFFSTCNRLLKDDGQMLIQAITISDQRFERAKKSVDFIQRYIFPGGCLPSNTVIHQHLRKNTNMQMFDVHDITFDYTLTLKAWRKAFFENISQVKALGYPEEFIRLWDFYLSYCEGGFLERVIQTSQFMACKPKAKPVSRHAL